MVKNVKIFFKKIIVILSIIMILISFVASSTVSAASNKIKLSEGDFYYSGVAEGSYVVVDFWGGLIDFLGQIVDFLIGLATMGGRMVFVGWTALIEEMITSILESSSGIPMESNSNIDPTNIDGAISSSNNVTVEAIVFNKVPILDINLFEMNELACVSGTGNHFVFCETCYNQQQAELAAQQPPEEEKDAGKSGNPYATGSTGNMYAPNPNAPKKVGRNQMICKMKVCNCTECWQSLADAGYLETDSSGNYKIDSETQRPIRKGNAVSTIKEQVSKWYYIMRLIAIAGMLIVLLAIGIKMAISNIASEKALYKRMLVDWVVGMILLFFIHYYMLIVINVNETFVDFIANSDNKVGDMVMKEFNLQEKEGNDYEIGIYQAVRTRAYDAKMINGTTGTVLYIALVFITIKFVFIYLKRYLSIIILTLMAPGIAFSYAIQKVFSGKSKAFGTWMHEYFITVFIQTVHALVYTIFVMGALRISLNSIPGMILAFIFLNFMLKADDIFRKLFKLSGGSADEAMNAPSNAKQLGNTIKSAAGIMTAGGLLAKSPVTKLAKAPFKAAGREMLLGASRIKSKIDSKNEVDTNEKNMKKAVELDEMATELQSLRERFGGNTSKDFAKFMGNYDMKKDAIGLDGQDAMQKEIEELLKIAEGTNTENMSAEELKAFEENKARLQSLSQRFDSVTTISTSDVFKAHLDNLLNKDNYYEYDENGKLKRKYGLFGKMRYDREKNKWVRDSMNSLIAERLKPENLLGMDDKDKALLKETAGMLKDSMIGMGSMFVGLGTIVTNPGVGMGLLAAGATSMSKFKDKTGINDINKDFRLPLVDEKDKKFSFKRFNKGAKQNIVRSVKENAEKEKDRAVVENVRKKHKTLYRTLRLGGAGLVVAGTFGLGATVAAPIAVGAGVTAVVTGKAIKRFSGYSQNSMLAKISKHHFKQFNAMKNELVKDEVRLLAREEEHELEKNYALLLAALDKEEKIEFENTAESSHSNVGIELESGEVLYVRERNFDSDAIGTNGELKSKIETKVIEEAVAKVMVDKILKEVDLKAFDPESLKGDAKEEIIKILLSEGIIEDAKQADSIIKNIDDKIVKEAQKMLEDELSGNTSTSAATAIDEALVEAVVREKVESKEISSVSDISEASILAAVEEKRGKILGRKSSDDVIKEMQSSKDGKKTEEMKLDLEVTDTLAEAKKETIKKEIDKIKKKSKSKPQNEDERRSQKKKSIDALDGIMEALARGDTAIKDSESGVVKSIDEVVRELFSNTETKKEAIMILNNMDQNVGKLKRLNVRGDEAKMQSKNNRYHEASDFEKNKKAFDKYPGKVQNGARQQTSEIGGKATYGPVTDIVATMKNISKNKRS